MKADPFFTDYRLEQCQQDIQNARAWQARIGTLTDRGASH